MAFHGGIHFRVCLSVPRNFVGVYGGNAYGKLWRQRRLADHIGDIAPESAVDSGLCCHDNGSGLLPFCMGRRRHQKGCQQTGKTAAADRILHIIGGISFAHCGGKWCGSGVDSCFYGVFNLKMCEKKGQNGEFCRNSGKFMKKMSTIMKKVFIIYERLCLF